jgi:hypothetical protein
MATRLDTGNIQLRQPGSVPMRQIEPRPVQYFAGKVEAEYSQVMGKMLDRMSAGLFEYADKLRSEEGLKWAAENQITEQQLIDMKGGIDVDIGAGRIIRNGKVEKSLASMLPSKFNEAVIKARSAELAFKFEQQGVSEMVKMLEAIDNGPSSGVSAKNIIQEINTITNGHYKVLAEVDPAAAIRYNATMATHGNTVYKSALKAESEYNKRTREIDFVKYYQEKLALLVSHAGTNPESLDTIGNTELNIIRQKALLDVGVEKSQKYISDFEKDFRQLKIDVIKKELRKEDYIKDFSKTMSNILSGNLGKLSPVLQSLQLDSKAIEDISKEFNIIVSYRRQEQQDADKALKEENHKKANTLLLDYHNPKTSAQQKRGIAVELTNMGVLSIEQIEHFLKPEQKNSNPYFVSQIEFEIESGTRKLTIPELNKIASRLNFSSADYSRISNAMSKVISKEESDVKQELNAFAGFGNNVGMISRDDSYKVIKRSKLNEYYNQSKNDFIDKNPGKPIPFNDLKNQALEKYKSIDENDRTKQNATKQINNILEDYKSDKIKESDRLPKSLVINEDTSISDLKLKYPKIKSDDIKDLIRLQKKLRGEN